MPECKFCGVEMYTGASCVNRVKGRIRYGMENRFEDAGPVDNCPGCSVSPGGYHHILCDQEECNFCGGQAVACRCFKVSPSL